MAYLLHTLIALILSCRAVFARRLIPGSRRQGSLPFSLRSHDANGAFPVSDAQAKVVARRTTAYALTTDGENLPPPEITSQPNDRSSRGESGIYREHALSGMEKQSVSILAQALLTQALLKRRITIGAGASAVMSMSGISSNTGYGAGAAAINKRASSPSFAGTLDAAAGAASQAGSGVKTADFTHMTRKGLADWVNTRIKNGELSLDGTEGFVAMTARVPVDGSYSGLDDTQPVNFMQTAQDGMTWARQHSQTDMLASLQTALGTMQRYQGQISTVDLAA